MKYIRGAIILAAMLYIIGCSSDLENMTFTMPNLDLVADGVYRGNYDSSSTPVKAAVDVTVQNHHIIMIDILEHSCSPIGKKAEKIIDAIIEHQSLDVDVISGATVSSKTLLKAVENAFQ